MHHLRNHARRGSLTNFWGLSARSRPRQLPQEVMGFLRPPPACLTSEHHQTGPTLVARELQIPEFFGSPRLVQRSSVTSSTLLSRSTIWLDNTDHCGVDGQLSAMEKREAVCHHFQSDGCPPWARAGGPDPDPDVLGDSSTCFSADSGSATLQWKPSATQDPCVGTSSPVMATRVKWLATQASCRRQGELAPKGTKEQHPKALRVKTSCSRDWSSEEMGCWPWDLFEIVPELGQFAPTWERLQCSSIGVDAKACQPILGNLGNSSSGWNAGSCPLSISPQSGTSIPAPWRRVRHSFASKWNPDSASQQRQHQVVCNPWVTALHHRESVSPAGPKCRETQSLGVPQTQTNLPKRTAEWPFCHTSSDIGVCNNCSRHPCLMTHREMETLFRVNNPKELICS